MKKHILLVCMLSGIIAFILSILKMDEINKNLLDLQVKGNQDIIEISKWIGISLAVIGEVFKPMVEVLFFSLIIFLSLIVFGTKDSYKSIFKRGILSYYFILLGNLIVIILYLFNVPNAEYTITIPFLWNINIFVIVSFSVWCYSYVKNQENRNYKLYIPFVILFLFSLAISAFSSIIPQ
ncbi:hypothetical protein ON127_12400 [Bacillus pumilus]|uniref:hypothetical protein n=1 Tax=Bacillus pumilus TaxID=1408 RepID=UPI0022375598|nr:hypothetical protein [Bacillus pumilus]MCW4682144.1 hypothetical protein [Bacillus pumilus]